MKKIIILLTILLSFTNCQKETIEIKPLFLQKAAEISTVWISDDNQIPTLVEIVENTQNALLYYVNLPDSDCWVLVDYFGVETNATLLSHTQNEMIILYDNGNTSQIYTITLDTITGKMIFDVVVTNSDGSGYGYVMNFTASDIITDNLKICN